MHVKRLIVFGSSIRYDCDITSDLDLCIEWTDSCRDQDGISYPFTLPFRRAISRITEGNADVVNYELLDETYLRNAVMEGAVVYGNDV